MSARRALATTRRILRQLRHDPRTVAMILLVPVLLMTLLRYVFNDTPMLFQRVGPILLAVFPFILMFVVTSVAMLRERSSGTLERLLTTPTTRLDILIGYALAFGAAAALQVGLVAALVLGPLGLVVPGSVPLVVAVAILDAVLGVALGLFFSAFARTEFQAVQLLPAVVFPQLLLCGLFASRNHMAAPLRALADLMPLSYAVDGVQRLAGSTAWDRELLVDLAVVAGAVPIALIVGSATLRRRTR